MSAVPSTRQFCAFRDRKRHELFFPVSLRVVVERHSQSRRSVDAHLVAVEPISCSECGMKSVARGFPVRVLCLM